MHPSSYATLVYLAVHVVHRCYTVVTPLLHRCYTVVIPLIYAVVTLLVY